MLHSSLAALPNNRTLRLELAWRLVTLPSQHQDLAKALASIRQAQLQQEDDRSRLVYAFVLSALGQTLEALSMIDQTQPDEDHDRMYATCLKARLLAESGKAEEARQCFANLQTIESRIDESVQPTHAFGVWESFRADTAKKVARASLEAGLP